MTLYSHNYISHLLLPFPPFAFNLPLAQLVKNLPAMQETWVQSLGWEDPLEKEKATRSSILSGEFPGLYSPRGHKESDTTEQLSHTHTFPALWSFSSEPSLHIMWPKYWSFSFNISPYNEYFGLISFRSDWFDLLAVQGILKSFSSTTIQKYQIFGAQPSLRSNSHICT